MHALSYLESKGAAEQKSIVWCVCGQLQYQRNGNRASGQILEEKVNFSAIVATFTKQIDVEKI